MYKAKNMLETIYEVDEETIREEVSCQTPVPRFRLPCYICWALLGGCFLIISLIIAFSFNPFFSVKSMELRRLMKTLDYEFDRSIYSNSQLQSPGKLLNYIDRFARQINEELNLPPHTITLFSIVISNNPLALSNPVSAKENLLTGIYLHLEYPQFCWDNQQCRGNFQVYLNYTVTKLADVFANVHNDHLSSGGIQLNNCMTIENSTSTTLVTYVSTPTTDQHSHEKSRDQDLPFCDDVDHYYLLLAEYNFNQRHKNMVRSAPSANTWDNPTIIDVTEEISATHLSSHHRVTNDDDHRSCTGPTDCSNDSKFGEYKAKPAPDYCFTYGGPSWLLAWNSV